MKVIKNKFCFNNRVAGGGGNSRLDEENIYFGGG